ncbi:MAG: phage holin family protein [Bacilli bacterium]|nr:phage holin family protein [Bacilli bacterium]
MGYEIKKLEIASAEKSSIEQRIKRQKSIGWELISKEIIDTGIMVIVLKFRREQDTPYYDELVKIERKIEDCLEERRVVVHHGLMKNQEKKKMLFAKVIFFIILLFLGIFSLLFSIIFIGAAVSEKNFPLFGLFALFIILAVIFFSIASAFMKKTMPRGSFESDMRNNFELQEIEDRIIDLCNQADEIKNKYK